MLITEGAVDPLEELPQHPRGYSRHAPYGTYNTQEGGHAQQVDPITYENIKRLQQSLARSAMHDLVVSGHKFGTGTQSIAAQLPIVF